MRQSPAALAGLLGIGLSCLALAGFLGLGLTQGLSPAILALGGLSGVAGVLAALWFRHAASAPSAAAVSTDGYDIAAVQGETLDHLLMPVAVFDADQRLVVWNALYRAAFSKSFARLEAQGNRRPTFRDLVNAQMGPDASDVDRENAWQKAMSERPPADGTFREFRCDTMGWVQVGRKIMPSGLELRIANDLNTLKSREIALEAALTRAREAERRSEALISAVSHDLRSPLASISAGVGVLQNDPGSNEAQEVARMILRTSNRMRKMIDGMLDGFGKPPEAQADAVFDLRALAGSVLENAGFLPAAQGLALRLEWPEDLVPGRIGNEQALWQVMTNLVTNAVTGTDSGEVSIAVRDAGSKRLRIEVRDSGPGMTAEQQDQLFDITARMERFERHGRSMGLVMAKEIVEALNGKVVVNSRPGEGTTFALILDLPPAGPPALGPAKDLANKDLAGELAVDTVVDPAPAKTAAHSAGPAAARRP